VNRECSGRCKAELQAVRNAGRYREPVGSNQQVAAIGFVAPAKAEAQKHADGKIKHFWIPADAGMTEDTLLG